MKQNLSLVIVLFVFTFSSIHSYDKLPTYPSTQERMELDSLLSQIKSSFMPHSERLIQDAREAYQLAERLQLPEQMALAIILEGRQHNAKGNLDVALEKLTQGLQISEEIAYLEGIVYAKTDIGSLQSHWGDHEQGMLYLQEAMQLAEANHDTTLLDWTLKQMGTVHIQIGHTEEAIAYFRRQLEMQIQHGDERKIAAAHTNLGHALAKAGKYEEALETYQSALLQSQSHKMFYGTMHCLSSIGWIEEQKGQLDKALQYNHRAKEVADQLKLGIAVCEQLINISRVEFKQEKYQASLAHSLEAIKISEKEKAMIQGIEAHRLAAENQAQLGKYVQAYLYRVRYDQLKDTLSKAGTVQQVRELKMRFQTEKKEAENIRLTLQQAENELIIRQKNINFLLLGLGMLVISSVLLVLYRDYRRKDLLRQRLEKKVLQRTAHLLSTNHELETANQELERFAFIASHDLKEPLRNISGFMALIDRDVAREQYDNLTEYVGFVQTAAKQMNTLIKDVLEYSRLDINRKPAEQMNRAALLSHIQGRFSEELAARPANIEIVGEFNAELPQVCLLVLDHLLENALTYTSHDSPHIKIEHNKQESMQMISVVDNGIGIAEEYQEKIFDLFSRLHNRSAYNRSGLGLALCKKIVHRLGGQIGVESVLGEGSRFWFTIHKV